MSKSKESPITVTHKVMVDAISDNLSETHIAALENASAFIGAKAINSIVSAVNEGVEECYWVARRCVDYSLAIALSACPKEVKMSRSSFIERVALNLGVTQSFVSERLDALYKEQSQPATFSIYEKDFFVLHKDAAPFISPKPPKPISDGHRLSRQNYSVFEVFEDVKSQNSRGSAK